LGEIDSDLATVEAKQAFRKNYGGILKWKNWFGFGKMNRI